MVQPALHPGGDVPDAHDNGPYQMHTTTARGCFMQNTWLQVNMVVGMGMIRAGSFSGFVTDEVFLAFILRFPSSVQRTKLHVTHAPLVNEG